MMYPKHKSRISKLHVFKETASVYAFENVLSEDMVVGKLKGCV